MKYGHKWHKWLREWQRGYIILHKKMKFSIKDFFSKGYQIRRILRNWSHLLKKPLMENFIFLCSIIVNPLIAWNGLNRYTILRFKRSKCSLLMLPEWYSIYVISCFNTALSIFVLHFVDLLFNVTMCRSLS